MTDPRKRPLREYRTWRDMGMTRGEALAQAFRYLRHKRQVFWGGESGPPGIHSVAVPSRTDEATGRAAKAIYDADTGRAEYVPFEDAHPEVRNGYREMARAAAEAFRVR